MGGQELSRKDRGTARAAAVQQQIEQAKADALWRLNLTVGEEIPMQYGLNHRVPSDNPNQWFTVGEWHYENCPGPFTVASVKTQGRNASDDNKKPVIMANAVAHLICNTCNRAAIISHNHGGGGWIEAVDSDPPLPH